MNTSPKQRFMADEKLARQFLDVVDSEAFQRATELAMLALLDENEGNWEQVVGARRFLELLKALPEPPKPAIPQPSYNLPRNVT